VPEAVIEGMGGVLDLHCDPRRGLSAEKAAMETVIDWNEPNLACADSFITSSLNRYFAPFKDGRWYFTSLGAKGRLQTVFLSKVLDRLKKIKPKFSMMHTFL